MSKIKIMSKSLLKSMFVAGIVGTMAGQAMAFDLFGGGTKDGEVDPGKVAPTIQKCAKPLGRMAVYEPKDATIKALHDLDLSSPTVMLQRLAKESNCFEVVERGYLSNMMQERALAGGGNASGVDSAEYVLTPDIVFSNYDQSQKNAGSAAVGVGSALLGPLGFVAGAAGALFGGGPTFKQAQATLTLADTRRARPVASGQGSASKTSWSLGPILGAEGLGSYESTHDGKASAAAFVYSFNTLVANLASSGKVALVQPKPDGNKADPQVATASAPATVPAVTQTPAVATPVGAEFSNGDVVQPKLSKITLYVGPAKSAKSAGQFIKTAEAIADGREENGYVFVRGDGFSGWVDKALVRKL